MMTAHHTQNAENAEKVTLDQRQTKPKTHTKQKTKPKKQTVQNQKGRKKFSQTTLTAIRINARLI